MLGGKSQISQVMLVVYASGGENRASSRARFVKHAHATSRQDTPGFGVGGVTVTFMSTCRPRTCYVTPGFGVGGSLLMFMSACRPHIFLFIWCKCYVCYLYIYTYCYISNVSYVEFMLFVVAFCDICIYLYMHKKFSFRYGMLYITICYVLYMWSLKYVYIYII